MWWRHSWTTNQYNFQSSLQLREAEKANKTSTEGACAISIHPCAVTPLGHQHPLWLKPAQTSQASLDNNWLHGDWRHRSTYLSVVLKKALVNLQSHRNQTTHYWWRTGQRRNHKLPEVKWKGKHNITKPSGTH